jgi:LPS export ABC transporter protein LptC
VGLLLLALACSKKAEPPPIPGAELEDLPRQVVHGFSLRATSVRGLLWVLDAKRATSAGPGEPTKLDSMVVRFYDGEAAPRSVLTSREGTVVEKTNALVARDSVVVLTSGGERLETQTLRWDPKEERITTDEFFRLTRGRDVMTGIGIDAEPGLERYRVHSQVRAEVRDQDDSLIREEIDGPGPGKR